MGAGRALGKEQGCSGKLPRGPSAGVEGVGGQRWSLPQSRAWSQGARRAVLGDDQAQGGWAIEGNSISGDRKFQDARQVIHKVIKVTPDHGGSGWREGWQGGQWGTAVRGMPAWQSMAGLGKGVPQGNRVLGRSASWCQADEVVEHPGAVQAYRASTWDRRPGQGRCPG